MSTTLKLLIAFLVIGGSLLFVLQKNTAQSVYFVGQLSLQSTGSFNQTLQIQSTSQGQTNVWVDPEQRIVKLNWSPSHDIKVNGVSDKQSSQNISNLTDETVYLVFDPSGVFTELYYLPRAGLNSGEQNILLNTNKIAAHQVAWLAIAQANWWNQGSDLWGLYQSKPLHGPDSITIDTQTSMPSPSGMSGKSQTVIKLFNSNINQVITKQQQLVVLGKNTTGESENSFSLVLTSQQQIKFSLAEEFNVIKASWKMTPAWITVDKLEARKAQIAERLKSETTQSLFKQLTQFKAQPGQGYQAIAPLSVKLEEMLLLHPELASTYKRWALELGAKHIMFDEIIRALSSVGDPECQNSLRALANFFTNDIDTARKILLAIGLLDQPSSDTQSWLTNNLNSDNQEYERISELMLGQVGNRIANSSPDRAAAIDSILQSRLGSGKDEPERDNTLAAIGNFGSCNPWNQILAEIDAPTKSRQERAILAIRFCPRSQVADIYWRVFKQKSQLRTTVLHAAQMRLARNLIEAPFLEALLEYVSINTADKEIAASLVAILEEGATKVPALTERWQQFKSNCQSYCSYIAP
jgi:hypothetical protein